MSKETIKMRKLRLELNALKKSLHESEVKIIGYRQHIGEAWPHRDVNDDAFKTIKKYGRFVKREKAKIKDYSVILKSTKDEIKALNRRHDIHLRAIALTKAAETAK